MQTDGLRFEFEFHLCYFDLVSTDDVLSEKPTTNRPARDRKDLASLDITPVGSSGSASGSSSPLQQYMLQKRHMSCGLFGFDEFTWNAYGFCDSDEEEDFSIIFDTGIDGIFATPMPEAQAGQDSTATSSAQTSRSGPIFQPDPLSAGHLDANKPFCQPREYFLCLLKIRMLMVSKRWLLVTVSLTAAVRRHVGSPARHICTTAWGQYNRDDGKIY
jgi:hypothetical protein